MGQLYEFTESIDGKGILVPSASYGLIHGTPNGRAKWDTISVFASSKDTVARTLEILWGDNPSLGQPNADTQLVKSYTILPNALPVQVVPGLLLGDGWGVWAKASVANVILLTGFVNRSDRLLV